ncbi:hypothetical protein EB235_16510 [Mesorhizobium loti R88b]|uniref:Uncharacterized protein n=1 Tax=Mesorhizobium loti R88b TaxID=935548 RepID=A0A6M7WK57_RHILI|nr:hypothetical protein EB235_16510 [Mesorhizobium loti R88b]
MTVTRRTCLLCLILFAIRFSSIVFLAISGLGQSGYAETLSPVFNLFVVACILLFPVSIVSLMLSLAFPLFANSSVYRSQIRGNPILFLIWRDLLVKYELLD